jgi:hypothetical protein
MIIRTGRSFTYIATEISTEAYMLTGDLTYNGPMMTKVLNFAPEVQHTITVKNEYAEPVVGL